MIGPILALRAAIRSRLAGDAGLTGLLGGADRIYDEPPRASVPPYVVFERTAAEAWTGGAASAAQHDLALVAWSQQGGDGEAFAVAFRMAELLADASLTLQDHRLVLMRVVSTRALKPDSAGLRRVALTLSALTEPL